MQNKIKEKKECEKTEKKEGGEQKSIIESYESQIFKSRSRFTIE